MKKRKLLTLISIIIILLLIPLTTIFTNEFNSDEIRKITNNNQEGYFISIEYWQEIRLIINDYRFLQEKYKLLQANYNLLNGINIELEAQIKKDMIYKRGSTIKNIILATLAGIALLSIGVAICVGVIKYNQYFYK